MICTFYPIQMMPTTCRDACLLFAYFLSVYFLFVYFDELPTMNVSLSLH